MLPMIEQHRVEVESLCRQHHVGRLELFGSAATGDFNPASSDLDFLVEFAPLPPIQKADANSALLQALETPSSNKTDRAPTRPTPTAHSRRPVDAQRPVFYAD